MGKAPRSTLPRPALVLTHRAFRDARVRTIAFACLFAVYSYIQPVGFRHAYPTLASRLAFVHTFASSDALRLFYGYPYDPVTVGGYSAWRVGGTLAIVAAVFGLLAAVRALRSEEDAGRTELVLAGIVARRTAYLASMSAIGAGALLLGLAELAGFAAGGLPLGGSAYLALATVAVVPVYAGVGALMSQLAPTRRIALELGSALVGFSLLLRVVADTSAGAGWLRWATPLGWAEELRPFTGARPGALLLLLVGAALLLGAAAWISERRDVGTGLIATSDTAKARLRLLCGPTAQALRSERSSLTAWLLGVAAFALVLGTVSLPVGLLFLGIAALAFAIAPRAGVGIAYGLLTVAFLWELSGALLGAPKWLVDLTPFAHIGFVPAQHFRTTAALVMLALAGLASIAALWRFRRRDLTGA